MLIPSGPWLARSRLSRKPSALAFSLVQSQKPGSQPSEAADSPRPAAGVEGRVLVSAAEPLGPLRK